MKYVLPTTIIALAAALSGCDRPGTTASTTIVKEPATVAQTPAVVKEKETYVQRDVPTPAPESSSSTTIVNPPAQPTTTERSRTTTTSRIDTPVGTATETRTESTKTSQ